MNTVQILKALGDETRLRIVNILREGSLCVCEIESILQLTQSNASRHLNKLMNANLVTYYKEAKYIYYQLDKNTLNNISFINSLLQSELDKEEILKFDTKILKEYKKANLNCERVSETKNLILNLKKY